MSNIRGAVAPNGAVVKCKLSIFPSSLSDHCGASWLEQYLWRKMRDGGFDVRDICVWMPTLYNDTYINVEIEIGGVVSVNSTWRYDIERFIQCRVWGITLDDAQYV